MPVFWDIETRSFCDLRKTGGHVYAEDPTTEILCSVWIDGDRAVVWVPCMAQEPRRFLREAWVPESFNGDVAFHYGPDFPDAGLLEHTWVAHNGDNFDFPVWSALGLPTPAVESDSIHYFRRASLPGSLDAAAKFLLGDGKHEGRANMLRLSKPDKRTGRFLPVSAGNLPPVVAYCIDDVVKLKRIWDEHLVPLGLIDDPDNETLRVDRKINHFGIRIDPNLAEAIAVVEEHDKAVAGEELSEVSEGKASRDTLRSPKQFLDFVWDEFGLRLPNAQRKTLERVRDADDVDPLLKAAIEARIGENRVTGRKMVRALAALPSGGRIRGALAYASAQTWRWGGRVIQPQNLPSPKISPENLRELHAIFDTPGKPVEDLLAAVKHYATARANRGDVISSLTRGVIVPEPGSRFAAADWAAIEARGLMWLVGDQARLESFRGERDDPYKVFATDLYGVDYDDVTPSQRKVCKPAVLGCLAEGSPVLTSRGWVPIETVTDQDSVWDGEHWVECSGAIPKGRKDVALTYGVWMTLDHKILSEEGRWLPAETYHRGGVHPRWPGQSTGTFGSWAGTWGHEAPLGMCECGAWFVTDETTSSETGGTFCWAGRRGVTPAPNELRPGRTEGESDTPKSTATRRSGCSTESMPSAADAATAEIRSGTTTGGEGSNGGSTTRRTHCATCLHSPDTRTRTSRLTGLIMMGITNAETCGSFPMRRIRGIPVVSAVTYDIALCGPNSRFATPQVIAHNCGYQLGGSKMAAYAKLLGVNLSEFGVTGPELVERWRDLNPLVAGQDTGEEYEGIRIRRGGAWKDLQRAAEDTVRDGCPRFLYRCRFEFERRNLVVTFPSGSRRIYWNAAVEPVMPSWGGEPRDQLCYDKIFGGRVVRTSQYGGKWVENCLTYDTLVVTDRGAIPLGEVQAADLLWDGEDWVSHGGVKFMGKKEVGEWLGLRLTGDHLIRVGNSWSKVIDLDARSTCAALKTGLDLAPWWSSTAPAGKVPAPDSAAIVVRNTSGQRETSEETINGRTTRAAAFAGLSRLARLGIPMPRTTISSGTTPPSNRLGHTDTPVWSPVAPTRRTELTRTMADGGSKSRPNGLKTGGNSSDIARASLGSRTKDWTSTESTTTGTTLREMSGLSVDRKTAETAGIRCLSAGNPYSISTENTPPNGPCPPSDTTSQKGAHPRKSWVPTGRIEDVYDVVNSGPRHRFTVLTDCGPVVVHNCVQALCRDILAVTLVRLDEAGFCVPMHVHDEIVVETKEDRLEELCRIMATPPEWAPDFPLKAEGFESPRYLKEPFPGSRIVTVRTGDLK